MKLLSGFIIIGGRPAGCDFMSSRTGVFLLVWHSFQPNYYSGCYSTHKKQFNLL